MSPVDRIGLLPRGMSASLGKKRVVWACPSLVALTAMLLTACASSPTSRVEQRIDDAPIARAGPVRMNEDAGRAPNRRAAQTNDQASATDGELHNELIRGMIEQRQFYAAIAHIQAQRVGSGDSAELRWLEGDARRRLGELDEAARLFTSLSRSAYAASAQHGLGLIAATRGQPDMAIQHLSSAVSLQPTASEFRNDLGYAYLRAGRFDAALTHLATAAELTPNEPRVRNNLILLLLASGDSARAREMADASGIDAAGFARLQERARQFRPASTTSARRP